MPQDNSGVRLAQILGGVAHSSHELDLELSGILTEVGNIMINGVLGSLANLALGFGCPTGFPSSMAIRRPPSSAWCARPGTDPLLAGSRHTLPCCANFSVLGSLFSVFERGGLEAVLQGLLEAEASPPDSR